MRRGNFPDILCNSDCKVIKVYLVKKNGNVYQFILQLNKCSYDRFIRAGYLFVGYDSCSVFNAVEVFRCFKSNEYNHSSHNCSKPVTCPLCGGQHGVKQCKLKTFHCINCAKLKDLGGVDVDINHAVWDNEKCVAYIRACDKLRSDILAVATQ